VAPPKLEQCPVLKLLVCLLQDVSDNQLGDLAELRQELAACSELVCLSLAGNPCMQQQQQAMQQ
jgi:hypothetical protein